MSSPGPSTDGDHHVHSTFSDDAVSTPAENLAAAQRAGLREIRMVDHVRVSTTYVPEFLAAVRALPPVEGLTVLTGCRGQDARRLRGRRRAARGARRARDADGSGPGPAGRPPGARARRTLEPARAPASGSTAGLDPADLVEMLVTATIRAMHAVGRAQLAHPFSILPKIGLTEDDVPDQLLDALGEAAVATGTLVEVNEKWHCPGPAGGRPVACGGRAGWSRRPTRTSPRTSASTRWVRG